MIWEFGGYEVEYLYCWVLESLGMDVRYLIVNGQEIQDLRCQRSMVVNGNKLSIRVVDTIPMSLSTISLGWVLEYAFNNALRSKVMTQLTLGSRTHDKSLYERQLKSRNDHDRQEKSRQGRRSRHRVCLVWEP